MLRTRFAPSPNGPLHLGHAYAAIIAHDLARAGAGEFHLRIEDIDLTRSRSEGIAQIAADLVWLGLVVDGPVVIQSQRLEGYAALLNRLRAMGLLYPCRCSRREVAAAALAQGPDGPVYPGTCRGAVIMPDEAVAWRLDMAAAIALAGPLEWEDALAGLQRATPAMFGDVVLKPRDAPISYHLAVTLDDADDGITLVTRGADLFLASHVHRLLQALLGLPVPRWHHHGLLLGQDGRKLAKRRGAPSLADRRLAGEDGFALSESLRNASFPAGISLTPRLHRCP